MSLMEPCKDSPDGISICIATIQGLQFRSLEVHVRK